MVHYRDTQGLRGPVEGICVQPLPRGEKRSQAGDVVVPQQFRFGVGFADGAQRCRGGKEDIDLVVPDNPPESARIRCSYRFPLIEDGGGAGQQRPIDDVGVSYHPADVGSGPHDVPRADAVDVFHGPAKRHGMASVVPHHPLGCTRGSRGVEDVERVSSFDIHRRRRFCVRHLGVPVQPARVVRH
ncbi:hypothetical protein D9M72_442830 [compost metagenome]